MQIVPIWGGIEKILKEDDLTKDAIKQYEQGIIPGGIHTTPVCLIGRRTDIPLIATFMGDATGSRPRLDGGTIQIAILGRSYPALRKTELTTLDDIQHNVCLVLDKKANRTLDGTVGKSRIENMHDITIGDEYFGFELILSIGKMR